MEYEYQDVVIDWPKDSPLIDRHGYGLLCIQSSSGGPSVSIEDAKRLFWQTGCHAIIEDLKVWFDQGWEPVGQLGPEGIELKVWVGKPFRGRSGDTLAIPVAYNILLRRPKRG